MVSSTPRPHFTSRIDPVPILQEARWATGRVWTDGKSCSHRDPIPDRPARSHSLHRLSHPAHELLIFLLQNTITFSLFCPFSLFYFHSNIRINQAVNILDYFSAAVGTLLPTIRCSSNVVKKTTN